MKIGIGRSVCVERGRKSRIGDGCDPGVRTHNWSGATPAGNEAYGPLLRALRD